jgi:hypothetical protein
MGAITIPQVIAWIQAGQTLITVGAATIANIRTWMAAQHQGLTDADLNAICDAIVAGASRHEALANADAGKAA